MQKHLFFANTPFHIRTVSHRVIILNRGSMPRKRTRRKWCKFSRPECATSQRDVTRDCMLMALVGGGGLGVPRELQRLLSMEGVCGRSLTSGKILFAGRQTCSLYLVWWLCAVSACKNLWAKNRDERRGRKQTLAVIN